MADRFTEDNASAFDFGSDGSRRSIFDDHGTTAGTETDGTITTEDNDAGKQLAYWLANGVPGLRGTEKAGTMVEIPCVFHPDHPLFGLALLDHLERIGWSVIDDADANEWREKMVHGRWWKGGQGSGNFRHSGRPGAVGGSGGGGEKPKPVLVNQTGTGWGGKPPNHQGGESRWLKPGESQKPKDDKPPKEKPVEIPAIVGKTDQSAIGKAVKELPEIDYADKSKAECHKAAGWEPPVDYRHTTYGAVLFNDKGQVLLREPSNHYDGYHWTMAKGCADSKDEHPVDVAMREVEEETGHVGETIGAVPGSFGRTVTYTPRPGQNPADVPPPEKWQNNYFIMRSAGHDAGKMDWETQSTQWVDYKDAVKLINRSTNTGGKDRDLKVLHAAYKEMTRLAGSPSKSMNGRWWRKDYATAPDLHSHGRWWIPKDFREEDHPRDEHGKFTSGGESRNPDEESIHKLLKETYGGHWKPDEDGIWHNEKGQTATDAGAALTQSHLDDLANQAAEEQQTGPQLPKTTIVDTSNWKATNTNAQSSAKKIAMMEKLLADGKIAELMAMKDKCTIKSNPPNQYQKGIWAAWQGLAEKSQENVLTPPAAIEALKPVVAPPEPVPEPQVQSAGTLNADGWKNVGGQFGSNPGGSYLAPDGTKYYVKFPANEAIARNEVLTGKLYQATTGNVADYQLVSMNGKVGVASKWEETEKPTWSPQEKTAAQADFATHAWLANWDCIGTGGTTNLEFKDGKPLVVDPGGGLEYRAQGAPKGEEFGKECKEWDSLRDKSTNPQTAKVFGGMTEDQLYQSAASVAAVPNKTIKELVEKYHGGTAAEKLALYQKLFWRKEDIKDKANAIAEKMKAAEAKVKADDAVPVVQTVAPTPEPVKVETPPPAPKSESTVPAALPPPHKCPQSNINYQKKFNALYEAALKGDVDAVCAIKTNPDSHQTYANKLHAYKLTLLACIGGDSQPHEDHKPVVEAATKAAKSAKTPKVNPAEFPSLPNFSSSKPEVNEGNKALAEKCLAIAATGDIEALKAAVPPDHPSKGTIVPWHQSLVSVLNDQLHPPPPPKQISGNLKTIHEGAPVIPVSDAKDWIGRTIVLADAGGVPAGIKGSNIWAEGDWQHGKLAFHECTKQQQEAISNYTDGHYAKMNSSLRNPPPSAEAKAAAQALNEHSILLKEGTVLSRKHSFDGPNDYKKLLTGVGKVLQDPCIGSTSTDKSTWHGNVHWKLTIGPGVKGLPVKSVSQHSSEDEVLLPPGTRMLVTSVKQVKSGTGEKGTYSDGAIQAEAIILPTMKWKG